MWQQSSKGLSPTQGTAGHWDSREHPAACAQRALPHPSSSSDPSGDSTCVTGQGAKPPFHLPSPQGAPAPPRCAQALTGLPSPLFQHKAVCDTHPHWLKPRVCPHLLLPPRGESSISWAHLLGRRQPPMDKKPHSSSYCRPPPAPALLRSRTTAHRTDTRDRPRPFPSDLCTAHCSD